MAETLDDFQQLNNLIYQEDFDKTTPVVIEVPNENIWKAVQGEVAQSEKIIEQKKAVYFHTGKSESPSSSAKSTSYYGTASSAQPTSSSKKYYETTSYGTQVKTPGDIVDRDFKEIREAAFKMARIEMDDVKTVKRHAINPQLDTLMKRKGFLSSLKQKIGPGTWQKKSILVVGLIVTKAIAELIVEARQSK